MERIVAEIDGGSSLQVFQLIEVPYADLAAGRRNMRTKQVLVCWLPALTLFAKSEASRSSRPILGAWRRLRENALYLISPDIYVTLPERTQSVEAGERLFAKVKAKPQRLTANAPKKWPLGATRKLLFLARFIQPAG